MDYLLTFWDYEDKCTFEWFDTEEEMRKYAEDKGGMCVAEVVQMLCIKECEELK